jgi:HTH-type transcriptional regulator, sugar sensing transcriptional regulator
MDNIVDYLKQLDLSDVEAKLYLTLLKTGPASVRDLAQTVDIKRTTAYFYIDQLVEKGLIMKLVKGSKKLVAANDPENLQVLVEEKLKKAKEVQKGFPDILKALTTSLPKENNGTEAEIKYYKGKSGVKKIYEESLGGKELRSFVNVEEVLEAFPENAQLFNNAFDKNPEMIMYEIAENSSEAKNRIETSNKNHIYKLLPKGMKLTAQDILIYENKVAIIHFRDQINAIVLHNADLYSNLKLLFDFIWKILPE